MLPSLTAYVFIALMLIVAAFQIAIAAGAPWGAITWGGKYPGQMPPKMRLAAVASTILLLSFALIVAVRAGLTLPDWQPSSQKAIWGVVVYCGLGILANTFTPSRWERIMWLPVVLVAFTCSVIVAQSH